MRVKLPPVNNSDVSNSYLLSGIVTRESIIVRSEIRMGK